MKNVLVIGGTGLIGSSIAKEFAEKKHNVFITGTKPKDKVDISRNLTYLMFDLSAINSYDSFFSRILSQIGNVDVLIYSAGIHSRVDFLKAKEDDFDRYMAVGIKGLFFFMQKFFQYFGQTSECTVIVINSISSYQAAITPNQISKWAIRGFIKGISKEFYGKGISIFGLAPHRIVQCDAKEDETNINDLIEIIIQMVSSKSQYDTGDTIVC